MGRHENDGSVCPASLLEKSIAAHGGRARWAEVMAIDFDLSSAGLAFSLHFQGDALLNVRARVFPHDRRVELRNYGEPGGLGVWTPEQVWLEDRRGGRLAERQAPRDEFRRWSKQFRWDRLDMLYFAGYALWNYLSFPFLLASPGVELLGAHPESGGGWRLTARFGGGVPTHSAVQSFYLDAHGLLSRHDYTADVIGSWAAAANFCQASTIVDGLRFYTRRQVFPRLGVGRVLPLPILVWIEMDDMRLELSRGV